MPDCLTATSAPTNASVVKFTARRYTANCLLKQKVWTNQSLPSTSVRQVPLTCPTTWKGQIFTVRIPFIAPVYTLIAHCAGTDLLLVLDDLERFARESPIPAALTSVQEARNGLDKLIHKMDGLEAGFDRIAERSCMVPLAHILQLY